MGAFLNEAAVAHDQFSRHLRSLLKLLPEEQESQRETQPSEKPSESASAADAAEAPVVDSTSVDAAYHALGNMQHGMHLQTDAFSFCCPQNCFLNVIRNMAKHSQTMR